MKVSARAQLIRMLVALVAVNLIVPLIIDFPQPQQAEPSGPRTHQQIPASKASNSSTTQQLPPPLSMLNHTTQPSINITHHIFYNVFLNVDTSNAFFRSLKIIDEQLRQLSENSFPYSRYEIFYNLLGGKKYYKYIGMDGDKNLCYQYPNLKCHLLKHYKYGGEELTLNDLYQYCRKNPTHRATYIHNKGSFRFSAGNVKNRRRATMGAVSDECANMPLSSAQYECNICGVKFQYIPFPLYQANMWSAECSYIEKLIPPKQYASKREALFERLWQEHDCLNSPPDEKMEETNWIWNTSDALFQRNVGLGRYALERWTLNHPSMIPCDLMGDRAVRDFDRNDTIPKIGRAMEMGKMVSKKHKARQSWLMQQEYANLYPNCTVNHVLVQDQAKPVPRPCWL